MRLFATISSAFASIIPNCQQAARFQSEALDRQLSFPKRLGLRLHLLYCRWCRRYGNQIRHLRQVARKYHDQLAEVPNTLSPAARDRIKHNLKSSG